MTSLADVGARARFEPRWESVGIKDLDALVRARVLAINIAQWMARVANSYVRAAAAKERIFLTFRGSESAFVTRVFAGDKSLEMRLPSLELQFLESGRPVPHIFDPEERSPAEAEAWLLIELLHRDIDRAMFRKTLPYSVPGLMMGDAEKYAPDRCRQGLIELTGWFANAAAALEAAADGPGATAIACWPQTLSLTVASRLVSGRELGFSPGTRREPEPHFYVRSIDEKKQSVLLASQLIEESDPMAAAVTFLQSAAH